MAKHGKLEKPPMPHVPINIRRDLAAARAREAELKIKGGKITKGK